MVHNIHKTRLYDIHCLVNSFAGGTTLENKLSSMDTCVFTSNCYPESKIWEPM